MHLLFVARSDALLCRAAHPLPGDPSLLCSLTIEIRRNDKLILRISKVRTSKLTDVTRLLTGDTRKIFVSNIKTVDESHSARVLIGCKPITRLKRAAFFSNYVSPRLY